MSTPETIINFIPAAFFPSISFGGTEPRYTIRGQNFWLKSKAPEILFATGYKGSRDLSEDIDLMHLTGSVSWGLGDTFLTGSGSQFLNELKPGSFVITDSDPSEFFVIEEVVSDILANVSRQFKTNSGSAKNAYVMPIIQPLGNKRLTCIRGRVTKYPRGHLLGVGLGEVKLNGQSLLVKQVITLTVVGTVGAGGGGTISVTVTAVGMTGTPKTISVTVANNDTATIVAAKIVAALAADADIGNITTGFFQVGSDGPDVVLVVKTAAANDGTMNAAYINGTSTGLTPEPTAAHTTPGSEYILTKQPSYLILDPDTNSYHREGFGVSLPSDSPTDPLITLTDVAGGTKNMFVASYGVRVVAVSDQETGGTGGYSQPSANYVVAIGTVNHKIHIVFNKGMSIETGQNAYDIYVTKYEDATAAALNKTLGPWYKYERVTAAQLATENSVTDGTVTGLFHNIEFADGELDALDTILSFDNFAPYDAEFVDLFVAEAGIVPIFFSCLGKATTDHKEGTSPGANIVIAKPDNPEAILRQAAVTTFDSDTILGIVNARGRWWLECENSLQTAILTGVVKAPVTVRSFWDAGFRNPFNMIFLKDYAFMFATKGFARSIGVGDTSDVDFEFSVPVDDFTTDWICSHELTAYDPKNKAICFFFSGRERQNGAYVTMVLPYLPFQNFWNPPIILNRSYQTETQTIGGPAGASVNLPVTVRAAGVPALAAGKLINVPVTSGDTAATVAGKVRTVLGADTDVAGFFDIIGTGADYGIRVKTAASTDTTMNLAHTFIPNIPANLIAVRGITNGDFIVSGTATVGQTLYFLAGGRKPNGTIEVKTYEFDSPDNIRIDCFMAWAYSGSEDTPQQVKGIVEIIGQIKDGEVEIHGVAPNGTFNLTALQNGNNLPPQTISIPDGSALGRTPEKRQEVESFSKWTARIALSSLNGDGRLDKLSLLVNENASRE